MKVVETDDWLIGMSVCDTGVWLMGIKLEFIGDRISVTGDLLITY